MKNMQLSYRHRGKSCEKPKEKIFMPLKNP